jgi:Tfp pilus assembly protein PilF
MRHLLLLLLTSLTLFGAGWEAALQRGLQAFRQGQCTTALQDLSAVVEQNQGIAQAYQAIAICETRLGRPDHATRSFQQVAQLRPHDWQAWNNLGANLIETGDPDKALSAFEKAAELNAGNELVWFNVGSTLLSLRKNDEAFQALSRALEIAPQDTEIEAAWRVAAARTAEKAQELFAQERYASAKALLSTVRPALESSSAWNNLLGRTESRLEEPEPALQHLQKALTLEPTNEEFLVDVGQFLIHYRAFDAAREMFEVGLQRFASSIRVKFLLALAYILEERRPEGVELLTEILAVDKEFEPAYKALGECYEQDRDAKALIALGEQFIGLRPASATGYYLKGMGHLRLATDNRTSMAPAIEALQKAVEIEPAVSDRHFTLGKALQWEERYEESIAELEKTIRLDPQHDRAHYVLATLYRRTGNRESAAKELEIHKGLPKRTPRGIRLLVETQPQ